MELFSHALFFLFDEQTNLLNRLGEKHPQYEFLKVLAVKCSYVLFGKEHMHSLLAELKDLRRLEDENQLRASMGLLVVCS